MYFSILDMPSTPLRNVHLKYMRCLKKKIGFAQFFWNSARFKQENGSGLVDVPFEQLFLC